MSNAGASTTAESLVEGLDLSGKTAVITGASGGLGLETARCLANAGCSVLLCARNEEKLQACVESLRQEAGHQNIHYQLLDLQNLDSVREAARQISVRFPAINFLVNNAGIMATPFERLENGMEQQFAVNHLGHFLLTLMLKENLIAASPARVVNLSSGGHKHANIDFDDLAWQKKSYNKWQAYGQSKTANVLFTVALDARWKHYGIRAFAVHPGAIPTDLGRHLTQQDIEDLMSNAVGRGKLHFKTVPEGAATTVWAVTAPELADKGGLYLEDCGIAACVEEGVAEHGYYSYAMDKQAADRLWAESLKLSGLE